MVIYQRFYSDNQTITWFGQEWSEARRFTKELVLATPDLDKKVDTSDYAMGGVLFMEHDNR